MADIELIHAGLPWNNPQKITVKADEYISQLVINRGLLNLLSNDYYLDLKTQRINQYIVQLFGPHINDTTIHWTKENIEDMFKTFLNERSRDDGFGLTKDTAYIIPVEDTTDSSTYIKTINRIQNIINNCPKNLNGYTAIFALTPIVEENNNYNKTIGQYYVNNRDAINDENYTNTSVTMANSGCFNESIGINLKNKSINLDGFFGGTLILMGNNYFVCEEKYKNGGKDLSTRETRILLEQLQKNIDKNITPNITLSGNGLNNSCSVVSFNNCMCDSYIWNLNVTLDTSIRSTTIVDNLPYKKDLSLFIPANLVDDTITGNIRYIVADTINKENFTETYLTFRAMQNKISSYVDENNLSAVCLNNDYLTLSGSFDDFRQVLFGQYEENGEYQFDSIYNGATFGFWMKQDFYGKNVNEVPVLYSIDSKLNGFYIGLEKIASIVEGNINKEQYLETAFSSKKRTDISNKWLFWTIQIQPKDINNVTNNMYKISINYTDPDLQKTNPIIPNKLLVSSDDLFNTIFFNNLNYGLPLYFFGTPNTRSEANIRNILLFNKVLKEAQINEIANLKIDDIYSLSQAGLTQTFTNSMKGALYVYNTTAMNVIGCNLSKI